MCSREVRAPVLSAQRARHERRHRPRRDQRRGAGLVRPPFPATKPPRRTGWRRGRPPESGAELLEQSRRQLGVDDRVGRRALVDGAVLARRRPAARPRAPRRCAPDRSPCARTPRSAAPSCSVPRPAYSRCEMRSGAPQRGHGRADVRSPPRAGTSRCTTSDLLHRHLPMLAHDVTDATAVKRTVPLSRGGPRQHQEQDMAAPDDAGSRRRTRERHGAALPARAEPGHRRGRGDAPRRRHVAPRRQPPHPGEASRGLTLRRRRRRLQCLDGDPAGAPACRDGPSGHRPRGAAGEPAHRRGAAPLRHQARRACRCSSWSAPHTCATTPGRSASPGAAPSRATPPSWPPRCARPARRRACPPTPSRSSACCRHS